MAWEIANLMPRWDDIVKIRQKNRLHGYFASQVQYKDQESAGPKKPGRLRNMSKTNNQQTKQMQTSTAATEDQSQRGQALLEFALVLTFVILPFTFVLVDGAIMLFTYAEVTNAAREAARAAAIYQYQCTGSPCATDPSNTFATYADQYGLIDTGRLNYVDTYFNSEDTRWLSALIGYSQCSRQITYPLDPPIDPVTNVPNPYREMDSLTLKLECPRRLLFGLVGTGQITLTASATMRIEPGGVSP